MNDINYNSLIEKMREQIKETMVKEKICGLAIALVDGNKIIWSEGFGSTDNTNKNKVTADTLFSTQSMGKTVTATTFMILASKGLIDLDDPIRKFYPEFTVNTKFGDKDQEIEKITFRRMLSHTAGFTHEARIGNNYDNNPCTFEEHIESIADTWLRSKVGSEYAYANIGLDLTGYVLGKIMNKTYPEVVKTELFQPLGMTTATLDINEALKHSFAKGNIGNHETPTVQIPMLGAGGVYISVNDQAKFAMLHLNEGTINNKQLITKENLQEMYQSQFEDEGVKNNVGLGIFRYDQIEGIDIFYHGGGGYGYLTNQAWIPKLKIAAIVFTNSMHHSGVQNQLVEKALMLMINEKTKVQAIEIDSESLKKFVGTYYGYRINMQNIVFEDGKLVSYNLSGKREILYPQSNLEFLTEDRKKITFILDEHQKVKSLKIQTKGSLIRLKYNDGPNDERGPNKKIWEKYLGIYEYYSYGLRYFLALEVFNGHLYIYTTDKTKLVEYQENILFTSDGEVLILDEEKIIFRNIPLTRIELNTEKLLEEFKSNINKKIAYQWTFNSLSMILYWLKGFDSSYEFILKTIAIDNNFKDNLRKFGNAIYGFRDLENAKKCFEKLLALDKEDENAKDMIKRILDE